jgi:GDP-L-fucose synthase
VKIYIAGINGMVGSAVARLAEKTGHEVLGKSSRELDLTDRIQTVEEINNAKPDVLVIAAAKVGGIGANSQYPVEFLSLNLQIQTNLIDAAHINNIRKVIFLGYSCIYPKFAPQPILETSLLSSALEETNEPYAIAKIAGLKLIEAYRKQHGHQWVSLLPTNLYGQNDNFDLAQSHVLPALMNKVHAAKSEGLKEVKIWGDGSPLREFLHVDDLAKAIIFMATREFDEALFNVGSGDEISILDLAKAIAEIVGYEGKFVFDKNRPNGTPSKLLDSSKINSMGWKAEIGLRDGLIKTYDWYLAQLEERPRK